jgi:Flp pilus assembly protein TadD
MAPTPAASAPARPLPVAPGASSRALAEGSADLEPDAPGDEPPVPATAGSTAEAPEQAHTRPMASEAPAQASPKVAPEVPLASADRSPEARLARTRELIGRGRFVEALAEARSLLEEAPRNPEAQSLAQQAEAELVVEDCLRSARAALHAGDRERALEELRRGFYVRRNDPRLLALHREAVQQ